MKKYLVLGLALCMVFGIMAGCGGNSTTSSSGAPTNSGTAVSGDTPAASSGDKIILQLGHPNPGTDQDHCHAYANFFKQYLEESSDDFEVQIFSDSQLGGLRDCIEGMTMGTVDMSINMNSDFGAFVPDFMAFDLPFMFANREQVYSVIYDDEITGDMRQKLYDEFNIKMLTYCDGGFRYFLNNTRPINTLEDFSGIKLRLSESPIFVKTFQALGCNPSTLPFAECFTAIQQRTIDGLELPILSTYTGHYHEIIKYMSLTGHFFTPLSLSISRSVWDTLTEEQQMLIQEAADKAAASETEFIKQMEEKDIAEMRAAGMEINEITPEEIAKFREAVQPIYDEFTPQIGEELVNKVIRKVTQD